MNDERILTLVKKIGNKTVKEKYIFIQPYVVIEETAESTRTIGPWYVPLKKELRDKNVVYMPTLATVMGITRIPSTGEIDMLHQIKDLWGFNTPKNFQTLDLQAYLERAAVPSYDDLNWFKKLFFR